MKRKQYKIELSDEAEQDFDNSYEFYANKSENVANSFYQDVNNSLEKITESPNTFPKALKDIRKFVMKKFPFIIYYQVKRFTIRVLAIFHASRNPESWQKRIEEKDE